MDFLTFDDLLKTALAVDASRRLELLTIVNYGAQGDGDSIKELRKSMMKLADPDFDASVNPNEGMRGLRALAGLGKSKKKRPARVGE